MSEDQVLQQRVMDELGFDPKVDAAHIGVAVRNGVATLTGHVESYVAKHAAEQAARRVRGVKAVAQDIEVRFPFDKKTSDDEIAARAVRILEWDVIVPHDAIKVKVEHGVVTLSGEVDWDFQRTDAEADVRRLGGVTAIINEIRVRPKATSEDIMGEIRAAFERTAEHDASTIRIDVRDGRVILSGKVQSWLEHDEALRAAWSVPGVTDVQDELSIARP